MNTLPVFIRLFIFLALLAQPSFARTEESFDDLAIDLINPMGSRSSLLNRFEFKTYQGDLPKAGDETKSTYLLAPEIPFKLKNGKNIVLRATIPISFGTPTYVTEHRDYADWLIRQRADVLPQEDLFDSGHGTLEDITFDLAYGGVNENGLITMFGLAGVIPSTQDQSIEKDQSQIGPEVAVGKITRWGIYGAWLQHLVDIPALSGKRIDYKTNQTYLKVFFAYGLGNGWQFISNPVIEYDWEGVGGNKLAIPLGGGISKTSRIFKIPVKTDLEIYYYIQSPDAFGPELMLNFSLTPVLGRR
jgi:hypothetical protein